MNFDFKPDRYDDGSGSDHWFSGVYKITRYEALESDETIRKEHFAVYFKPIGWKNWGNHTRQDTFYPTLEEAITACEEHAKVFPKPYKNDRFTKKGHKP